MVLCEHQAWDSSDFQVFESSGLSALAQRWFAEASSRLDFMRVCVCIYVCVYTYNISQSLAAEGTADPPGELTFQVAGSG